MSNASWVIDACTVTSAGSNYSNVGGLCEHGYEKIPWVEEALTDYLSPYVASSLKALVLLSKPCQTTSVLQLVRSVEPFALWWCCRPVAVLRGISGKSS